MNQVFNTSLKFKLDNQVTLIDNAIRKLPKDVTGFNGANSGIVPKLVDLFRIKYTLPTITVDLNEKRVENSTDNHPLVIYYFGYTGESEFFKYNPIEEKYKLFYSEITYTEENIEMRVESKGNEITPYIMINIDNAVTSDIRQIRAILNQIASEIDSFNSSLKDLIYTKIMNRA